MEFTSIKGFKDILPDEIAYWQQLEITARNIFRAFGFQEIRTPILEKTELFNRGIGEETDIVSKEMYSLKDSKGKSLTLRPEATASVVRAYIQNRLYLKSPVQKLFTIGPMFRHERPQKGRLRQFHQINAELFGDSGPKSDAEMITLAMGLFESMRLNDITLHINSLGCDQCREKFRDELKNYLGLRLDFLCRDCRRRAHTNPLRVFDCKIETCNQAISDAPSILQFLCQECERHFESLQEYLNRIGISFVLDHRLVRGLDYYTKTAFEIQTGELGAQNAIAGGGRYDGLVKLLGGPDHPAIGFAVGMERVVALLQQKRLEADHDRPDLFIAALGKKAEEISFDWAIKCRRDGLWIEMDYGPKGLKAQMKRAGKLNAKKVLIVGENELFSGKAVLRNMDTKVQEEIDLNNIYDILNRLDGGEQNC